MDEELIVVTHPEPVQLEVRSLDTEPPAEGDVALAYYHEGHLLARGFVASEAVKAIHGILSNPVSVALAATEDQSGNIEARFCLVLPFEGEEFAIEEAEDDEAPSEPWRASLPATPHLGTDYADADAALDDDDDDLDDDDDDDDDDDQPRVALLPIGNVVRNARERHHPDDMAQDLRDMLLNLMEGRAKDAVSKAIDDLLSSL
jgi:hypothetical protein